MMGALKGEFFLHQMLNKNRLCLAHCALNRSFTVIDARVIVIDLKFSNVIVIVIDWIFSNVIVIDWL